MSEKKKYRPALFEAVETDSTGTPTLLRLVRDEDTVNIHEGQEFWVLLVPENMIRPRPH